MITVSRIICSVLLLLQKPLSSSFFIIYLICGASDVLDGYIARKIKSTSKFGATIDSIADFVFISVMLIIFLPILKCFPWVLYWIGAIALLRFISLAVGFAKYHVFAFLHTYANKATGFAMFCFPLLYSILGFQLAAFLLCSLASLSAVEELIINIASKELMLDVRCIFRK